MSKYTSACTPCVLPVRRKTAGPCDVASVDYLMPGLNSSYCCAAECDTSISKTRSDVASQWSAPQWSMTIRKPWMPTTVVTL
jgi:hypothetical protein